MTTPWDRIEHEYRAYLTAAGTSGDEFNELATAERVLLLNAFKEYQLQQQQQQQQRWTTQAQFRQLLEKCNVTPSESVMAVILKHFASSATLVDSPEQAHALYLEAALLPRSVTRVVLQEQGISVADVFHAPDPSKAVLLHAHEHGVPRILKIATDKSIRHEWDVFSAVTPSSSHDEETFLVNVRLLQFESAEIELGDYSGGHSNHPPTRCGLLMKHFQGTLSQCKIPLDAEILLRYGKYLQKALSTLHKAGFCHLDVKPSNIFLFEDACYLGDYGAAVKTGDPIQERTTKYYPTDGDFDAKEETDMYLLAVTLLEMFGTIRRASERSALSKEEIHEKIASVETDEVRLFLTSLFDGR
eukprot:CAMPEP_0168785636 /NCGR_PEP_ID=MMETSP0725-20121227/10853_1 /TAXON_ID=265536 /ORGANISM="Amphiprora sp., Strain CCMP467" /LENGTH=357 /DNA_ID=CAMNT_0008835749 /DNA_START=70 /DNA_END=1146 /DNA_ORIENTATION=+